MKQLRKLVSFLSVIAISVSLLPATIMQTSAYAESKTVTLFEDDFSNGMDKWTISNGGWVNANECAKFSMGKDKSSQIFANFDAKELASLPATYTISLSYKIKCHSDRQIVQMLGTESGNGAYNITTNNSGTDAGFYYSIKKGTATLYGKDNGYISNEWYRIEVTADVDGETPLNFNYKIYDNKGTKVASVFDVKASGDAGSIIKPSGITFIGKGFKNGTYSAYIDDVVVTATPVSNTKIVEEIPAGVTKEVLVNDNFDNVDGTIWETGKWESDDKQWTVADKTEDDKILQLNTADTGIFKAKRYFDTKKLPKEYDLKIRYKAKATAFEGSKDEYLIGFLGSDKEESKTATISFNGSLKDTEDLTGIYSITGGSSTAIYDVTDGYASSRWYTVEIVAHIDGEKPATIDYTIYNELETKKLGQVTGIKQSGTNTVINPSYFMISRKNAVGKANEAYINDFEINAYYETIPSGYVRESVVREDFENAITWKETSSNSTWERNIAYDGTKWIVNEGALQIKNHLCSTENGCLAVVKKYIDTSNLPQEYDLRIKFLTKVSGYADCKDERFVFRVGTSNATAKDIPTGGSVDAKAATITINGSPDSVEDLTGIYYSQQCKGVALYKDGYSQDNWYQIEIYAHINGTDKVTFDYKVYSADGKELLGEVYGITPQTDDISYKVKNQSGAEITAAVSNVEIKDISYIYFERVNAKGKDNTVIVDDLKIDAFYSPNKVKSINCININGTKTALSDTIEKDFNQVEVEYERNLNDDIPTVSMDKEGKIYTLSGDMLTVKDNTIKFKITDLIDDESNPLTTDFLEGTYTITIDGDEEYTKTFSVVKTKKLTVLDGDWYIGSAKVTDLSQLSNGVNSLTLRTSVYNLTGTEIPLIMGYATYIDNKLKAVNFEQKNILSTAQNEKVEFSISVTKENIDQVMGFLWDKYTYPTPYHAVSIIK